MIAFLDLCSVSRLWVLIKFSHISCLFVCRLFFFVPALNLSQLADSCFSAIQRSNVFTSAIRGNLFKSSISDSDLIIMKPVWTLALASLRQCCVVDTESTLLLNHDCANRASCPSPLIYVSWNVFCSNKSCVMLSRRLKANRRTKSLV